MTKKEKKELEALRARYADDVRGRVSVRERLMEAVGGWGPSLAIMGAASYFAGAGLLEAAWGMGDAIGFFGVFVGKALGVGGVAFTARDFVLGALKRENEEDVKLLVAETEEVSEDELD
jgi:hypothetical protein